MSKKTVLSLDHIVDIAWLAEEICDITPRRLQQIMKEQRIRRAAHGKVRLGDGVRAFIRNAEQTEARKIAKNWTNDDELQQLVIYALIARWRGHTDKIAKLAE